MRERMIDTLAKWMANSTRASCVDDRLEVRRASEIVPFQFSCDHQALLEDLSAEWLECKAPVADHEKFLDRRVEEWEWCPNS